MAKFKIKDSRFVTVGKVKVEFNHKGFYLTEDEEVIKALTEQGFEDIEPTKQNILIREDLINQANELGLEFKANIKTDKLSLLIQEALEKEEQEE